MDLCADAAAVEIDANPRFDMRQHGEEQSRDKHARDHHKRSHGAARLWLLLLGCGWSRLSGSPRGARR
jgi:hypothetical protein